MRSFLHYKILCDFRHYLMPILGLWILLWPCSGHAQTIWNGGPGTWNTPASWSTGVVPGATDNVEIPGAFSDVVVFSGAAPLAASVTISGTSAVAGFSVDVSGLNHVTINGAGANLTGLQLFGTSSTGALTIDVIGNNTSTFMSAILSFASTTSADSSILTASGQAQIGFSGNATAANATIVNNNGGATVFDVQASAGNASITNNAGGVTFFSGFSEAAGATLTNNVGGVVDISLTGTSLSGANQESIGSLSGGGNVFLGESALSETSIKTISYPASSLMVRPHRWLITSWREVANQYLRLRAALWSRSEPERSLLQA